jgi:hypothetical protein
MKATQPLAAALVLLAGFAAIAASPPHEAKQTPPIKLGTSGGQIDDASSAYCCSGTLGAAVLRDGVLCILSNNHVLARAGSAPTGDDTIQPGLVDSACRSTGDNVVGDFAGDLVPLGTANVDTALSIARPGMVDPTGYILDVGIPCTTIKAPAVNMSVMKSGRTTGLSMGTITSINTSVNIQYQRGCNSGRKFTVSYKNQIVTTGMSAGGDSGSLLLTNDGNPKPVGLLYAGSNTTTVYNPIQDVVNAYTAGGHTFSFVGNTCASFVPDPVAAGPDDDSIQKALKVKVEHEHDLMKTPGVLGVGVGSDAEDVTKAAVIIYMEKPAEAAPGQSDKDHAKIPKDYDGVGTRVIFTDPFLAQ